MLVLLIFFDKTCRTRQGVQSTPSCPPPPPASCFFPFGTGAADPEGGSLYFEPHLFFDESELSKLHADVVVTPVVQQKVGPYSLVCGGYVWKEERDRERGRERDIETIWGGGARRLTDK